MIRPATIEDVPAMVKLGKAFFDSAAPLAAVTTYCADSMANTIEAMINDYNKVAFVMERGGKVVGGIGGALVPSYFNNDVLAGHQVFWFVGPAHRSIESLKLLDTFNSWCKDNGAAIIWSGAKFNEDHKKMQHILERRSFTQLESVFIRRA